MLCVPYLNVCELPCSLVQMTCTLYCPAPEDGVHAKAAFVSYVKLIRIRGLAKPLWLCAERLIAYNIHVNGSDLGVVGTLKHLYHGLLYCYVNDDSCMY